jgi:hypothetical protein
MSRTATQQRMVETYMSAGFSWFPLVRGDKTPLTAALPGRGWKQYQTRQPSIEETNDWFAEFGLDMGGVGFNLALVTGYNGLYVLDIDSMEIPSVLTSCNTTTVMTARGRHFYFNGPPGLASTSGTLDGIHFDFQATGKYVVAPVSIHPSGVTYDFVRPLSDITTISDDILNVVGTIAYSSENPHFPLRSGGRSCLDQIWARTLSEGERDSALYVLYQAAVSKPANNSPAAVAGYIRHKNEALSVPLLEREINAIVNRGREQDVPGHGFGLGCDGIRRLLPWVSCEGCHYADHRAGDLIRSRDLHRAMDELTPSEFKLFVANAMHGWDSAEHLSNMEAEKVAHLSNKTVCNGQRALREKGYL